MTPTKPRRWRGAALLLLLLPILPAHAGTLKIATWNIEWLTQRAAGDPALPADVEPRSAADFRLLAHYADFLAADVVALQEVDGPEVAARLFPPAQYALHLTADHVVQRTGFAIRRGIAFTANPDLAGLDVYPPDARRHLRSGADVTLALPGGALRLLAVHLKAGCWRAMPQRSACGVLAAQRAVLAGWIAARRAEGVGFVVLGDFNRRINATDDFFATLAQAAPLARATEGLADPCWGGGEFIDHILLGGPARRWLRAGSLRVMLYRETDPAWKDRLSDHCPLSVQLQIPDR